MSPVRVRIFDDRFKFLKCFLVPYTIIPFMTLDRWDGRKDLTEGWMT